MPHPSRNRVVGRDGLTGILIDPLPPTGIEETVRVQVDGGPTIVVPTSMLQEQPDGIYSLPIGPADLQLSREASNSSATASVVPVLAEELAIRKEAVPTGGIRVHRRVEEHVETVDIPLRKENVDVRRVLVDRPVDGPLPVRRDGETTIIPIVEEVLVVSKRFVLKEEIHVTRSVRQERHTQRVTLERQEAEVETVDGDGHMVRVQTPPTTRRQEDRPRRMRRRSILGED